MVHPAAQAARSLAAPAVGGPWQRLTQPKFSPGAMLLLTDGTVMVQDEATPAGNAGSAWWRLSPDQGGSYAGGRWTQLASMQAGYTPLYFASAVLPDGRVIVEGGEYVGGDAVWSGQGSIYDPVANTWTAVAPPAGMDPLKDSIGDAQGVVLANGTFMLSPVYMPASGPQQLFNAATLTWRATGKGKATDNDEEGQALLPSGKVLSVEINSAALGSELYDPATGKWTPAGSTVVKVYDVANSEVGPMPVRPGGDVVAIGATLGHNATYHAGAWAAAPDFPRIKGAQFGVADGPAATLPGGNVLILASAGYGVAPSHFFMFDGKTLTRAADTPNCPHISSYLGYMLVLPTGQVMFNDRSGNLSLYTDNLAPSPLWAPVVTAVPTRMVAGTTYRVVGNQLNGRSTGASYGDDYQSATNYPLVRVTNDATHHVSYARTSKFTNMSIQPNNPSASNFTLPAGVETGKSHLVVVANGIASPAVAVTLSR